jgi:hypothetical protein
VVGPLENVFHALPEIDGRFDDWGRFLAFLDGGGVDVRVETNDWAGEEGYGCEVCGRAFNDNDMVGFDRELRFAHKRCGGGTANTEDPADLGSVRSDGSSR